MGDEPRDEEREPEGGVPADPSGRRRYDQVTPRAPEGPLDLNALVPGTLGSELDLEIGFGRGASLFRRLEADPAVRLLGIEIKSKWTYKVDERRRREGIERLRVWAGDAREIVTRAGPDACLARVIVQFPDPWWKKRHGKRRVVGEALLDECARLLRDGGEFFVQTDVPDRAELYDEVIDAHPLFERLPTPTTNPYGAMSNREKRALEDGLPIHRTLARRIPR